MISSHLLESIGGYINGAWRSSLSGETRTIINPASGDVLAQAPNFGANETIEAVAAAEVALGVRHTVEQRRDWLCEIHRLLIDNAQELARIITLEQGKPLAEAAAEVAYAAGFFRHFSMHVENLSSKEIVFDKNGCRWTLHHEPAGVVGLIGAWNFPIAMLAKKISAAIAADCSVVMKPALETPLAAIAFCHLVEQLKLPPGKINLITGDAEAIGRVFCEHPAVRAISVTGSTETGRTISKQAAPFLKRLTLELGGNAPFIVFDDADIDSAVRSLIANKFRAAGQTCVCANRIYVHERIAELFLKKLSERMTELKVGNGLEPGVHLGPLINGKAFDKAASHIADAINKGATCLLGGVPMRPERDWGFFFPPTLLRDANESMLMFHEETFGPVVPVSTFCDPNEVVRRANETTYGLAGYVFTSNPDVGARVCAALQCGHVALNSAVGPIPEAPFGGVKQSGYGREGGAEGLHEFIEPKVVAESRS